MQFEGRVEVTRGGYKGEVAVRRRPSRGNLRKGGERGRPAGVQETKERGKIIYQKKKVKKKGITWSNDNGVNRFRNDERAGHEEKKAEKETKGHVMG